MASRFQPVWRVGEPLRLTYQVRGELAGLRLTMAGRVFPASIAEGSAEIVVPPELYSTISDRERVALQAKTSSGWESVANGFLVKEAL